MSAALGFASSQGMGDESSFAGGNVAGGDSEARIDFLDSIRGGEARWLAMQEQRGG